VYCAGVILPTAGFISLADEVVSLRKQVADFVVTVQQQNARVEWLEKHLFGKRSERWAGGKAPEPEPPAPEAKAPESPDFLGAPVKAVPGIEPEESTAQTEEKAEKLRQRNAKKGRGPDGKAKVINGGGRRPVNPALREIELIIEAPIAARVAADGTALMLLGHESSEREHWIPAELVRLVIKREIWGFPDTREAHFVAPVPPSIVAKGKYSDELIVEAIARKYVLSLPFNVTLR
jgi:hypothetical protein